MLYYTMNRNFDAYHETLNAALDAAERFACNQRAVINVGLDAPDSWKSRFSSLPYGNSHRKSFELLSYRGKETSKALHVSLYRLDSGRYELYCYVL